MHRDFVVSCRDKLTPAQSQLETIYLLGGMRVATPQRREVNMRTANKTIGSHMVKSPYTAEGEYTLKRALELMKECGIRHLPITENERLVGLVSERDIREALSLPQADQLRVSDVMKTELFVAKRSSPLSYVVRSMQKQKIGSALIVNDHMECVGIFTTIDALGILADLLESEEDTNTVLQLEDYIDFWNAEDFPIAYRESLASSGM